MIKVDYNDSLIILDKSTENTNLTIKFNPVWRVQVDDFISLLENTPQIYTEFKYQYSLIAFQENLKLNLRK